MSTTIIPAAPGTVAVWRYYETRADGATREFVARRAAVIAWAVNDSADYPPTPIGVKGNLTGYSKIVHPGEVEAE